MNVIKTCAVVMQLLLNARNRGLILSSGESRVWILILFTVLKIHAQIMLEAQEHIVFM